MALEGPAWSADPPTRLFLGISRGSRSGRLKLALVRARGDGWLLRCLAVDALSIPVSERSIDVAAIDGVHSLIGRTGLPLEAVDLVGLADLGPAPPRDVIATTIAERTGITVVSGFDQRDRAGGGRGKPLSVVPDWLLFRSPRLTRLLVHLGPALAVTLLPAGQPVDSAIAFDAGPGCDFLDALVRRLSNDRLPFDASGHFAVQGRACDDLVSKWLSHPYLLRLPPKFLDAGDFGVDFHEASLALARERKLTAPDVLCSANYFLIAAFAEALERWLPPRNAIDEVLVSGGGSLNGLLWKLLTDRLAPLPVARTDRAGIPAEARQAIHAALLAYCVGDNLPGNLPRLSGAAGPRILGHLTPGAPENWDRFVCNLVDRLDATTGQAA
jgi:anhydro-N-acetylmuramic acid kinase